MGLFGKSDKARDRNHLTSIVAEGTRLQGELNLDGSLHVDGGVEGSIQALKDVSIGCSGVVEATVKARNMVVCGYLKGNVECDQVEIVSGGTLIGNVDSDIFVVEPGARFDGEHHSRSSRTTAVARLGTRPISLQARLARDGGDHS